MKDRTVPWCCFIAPEANFNAPNMTTGDERAEADKFECKNKARWQIYYPPWSPDDNTQSCDEHRAWMTPVGGQSHPL